jgi:hypothetical protein
LNIFVTAVDRPDNGDARLARELQICQAAFHLRFAIVES